MTMNENITLAAVNRILATIAVPPLNTLEELTNVNAQLALSALNNVSEQVQSEDWSFNSLYNFTLIPDANSGKIKYPVNVIRLHLRNRVLVNRDSYVYDVNNQTDIFKSSIMVDEITFKMPFEELPIQIRNYIVAKAAREFQIGNMSSDRVEVYLQEQEARARTLARDWDLSEGNYNMFENTSVLLQNLRR